MHGKNQVLLSIICVHSGGGGSGESKESLFLGDSRRATNDGWPAARAVAPEGEGSLRLYEIRLKTTSDKPRTYPTQRPTNSERSPRGA